MHAAVALREAAVCDLGTIQTPSSPIVPDCAARAQGRPVLLTYHTFFEEYLHHHLPFLPAGVLRAGAAGVAHAVQCGGCGGGALDRDARAPRGYGVRSPMEVLPTGIPLQDFAAATVRISAASTTSRKMRRWRLHHRVAHEKNIGFPARGRHPAEGAPP